MASTPPPQTTIPVPPTPRHGAGFDTYGRSSSRRSERLAGRSSSSGSCSPPGFGSPRHRARKSEHPRQSEEDGTSLESGSPTMSAQRKADGVTWSAGVELASDSLCHNTAGEHNTTTRSSSSASASTSTFTSQHASHTAMDDKIQPTNMTAGMLPTPVKTPQKKAVAAAGTERRSLFQAGSRAPRTEESELNKTKGKNFSHFSLESFNSDPAPREKPQFEVFTDSRDRIPKVNQNMDNPFLSKDTGAEGSMDGASDSSKKRRKVDSGGYKRDAKVDEAVRRDDGLLYVFRGKKIFRKFKPESEGESDSQDHGLLSTTADSSPSSRLRPLTRSSVKPRVLFPNATQAASSQAEGSSDIGDEAGTSDAKQDNDSDHQVDALETDTVDEHPVTPPLKTVDPETPSGGRSLRSNTRKDQVTPCEVGGATPKRFSPFDRWRRTKGQTTPTKAKRTNANVSDDSGGRETKKLRGE